MIRLGKVVAIDEAKAKVRVQIEDADQVVTFWLPVLQQKAQDDKFYRLPDIGELVVCGFYSDDWDTGIVLGSIYNEIDLPPVSSKDKVHIRFKDGTELEYDRAQHKLKANIKGDVELKATGRADIETQGQIYIKSAVNITIQAPQVNMRGGSPAEGVFEGNLRLIGTLSVTGDIDVEGNIHATGTIIDEGGNTNHHQH
jgi:phage baseplate assembly protein V